MYMIQMQERYLERVGWQNVAWEDTLWETLTSLLRWLKIQDPTVDTIKIEQVEAHSDRFRVFLVKGERTEYRIIEMRVNK